MLALSRKVGQSIIIADNIEIMVISVSGETAKLGIRAPREIPVHRSEIYEIIKKENEMAAKTNLEDLLKLKK